MNKLKDWMRELLLPAAALTILASLWVAAWARNMDADVARQEKRTSAFLKHIQETEDEPLVATPSASER